MLRQPYVQPEAAPGVEGFGMERAEFLFGEANLMDGTASADRQHDVDAKGPLRGKGFQVWRKRIDGDLAHIHQAMQNLSAAVRADEARVASLNVYVRKATGQWSLRWRAQNGLQLTWPTVAKRLGGLPPRRVLWYEHVNEMAVVLNAQELARRKELQLLAKVSGLRTVRSGHRV
ncbi:MAG TPA: hypothetical protein VFR86_17900 [Burkholderiaceae bacterium]|nr:hypothetical protein [Burkholderiaceae bacterium]